MELEHLFGHYFQSFLQLDEVGCRHQGYCGRLPDFPGAASSNVVGSVAGASASILRQRRGPKCFGFLPLFCLHWCGWWGCFLRIVMGQSQRGSPNHSDITTDSQSVVSGSHLASTTNFSPSSSSFFNYF
jgi:hypothetical protein